MSAVLSRIEAHLDETAADVKDAEKFIASCYKQVNLRVEVKRLPGPPASERIQVKLSTGTSYIRHTFEATPDGKNVKVESLVGPRDDVEDKGENTFKEKVKPLSHHISAMKVYRSNIKGHATDTKFLREVSLFLADLDKDIKALELIAKGIK
jgi:hypothetical protein